MGDIDQKEELIEEIQTHLSKILEYSVEDLIREELGKQLNFRKGKNEIQNTLDLCRTLQNNKLDVASVKQLQQIKSQVQNVQNQLESISEFSADQRNPVNSRNSLLSNLDKQYNTLLQKSLPVLAYSVHNDEDLIELEKELNEKVTEAETAREEIQSVLKSAREASGELGVSEHAEIFKSEANDHKTKSKNWMWGAGIFAFLTILTGILYGNLEFFQIASDATNAQIAQFLAGKLVVLSVLVYGMVWCSKNYFASQHNYVVNKYRQNSLQTFKTFVDATDNQDIKNEILQRVTETIFSERESGYNKKGGDNQCPNLVKMITQAHKSQ